MKTTPTPTTRELRQLHRQACSAQTTAHGILNDGGARDYSGNSAGLGFLRLLEELVGRASWLFFFFIYIYFIIFVNFIIPRYWNKKKRVSLPNCTAYMRIKVHPACAVALYCNLLVKSGETPVTTSSVGQPQVAPQSAVFPPTSWALGTRKAISRSGCQNMCPVGSDISGYI